jgi:hypothetical protein
MFLQELPLVALQNLEKFIFLLASFPLLSGLEDATNLFLQFQ